MKLSTNENAVMKEPMRGKPGYLCLAWYSSTVNWRLEAAVSRPGVRLGYLVNQSLVQTGQLQLRH